MSKVRNVCEILGSDSVNCGIGEFFRFRQKRGRLSSRVLLNIAYLGLKAHTNRAVMQALLVQSKNNIMLQTVYTEFQRSGPLSDIISVLLKV